MIPHRFLQQVLYRASRSPSPYRETTMSNSRNIKSTQSKRSEKRKKTKESPISSNRALMRSLHQELQRDSHIFTFDDNFEPTELSPEEILLLDNLIASQEKKHKEDLNWLKYKLPDIADTPDRTYKYLPENMDDDTLRVLFNYISDSNFTGLRTDSARGDPNFTLIAHAWVQDIAVKPEYKTSNLKEMIKYLKLQLKKIHEQTRIIFDGLSFESPPDPPSKTRRRLP